MLGLTMSEEQRRAFQQRHTKALFERASGHQREAERRWKETLEAKLNIALNNSFGFGGINTSTVLAGAN